MRRRSQQIKLIALGTIVLSGCEPEVPNNRYVYENHEQCTLDWGEENCEHAPASDFNWFHGGRYCYGPYYNSQVNLPSGERIWSGSPGSPAKNPSSHRMLGSSSVNVLRGGFGGFAHSFSSGGG